MPPLIKQIFFIKIQIEVREISFCWNWWLCPTKHLQRCQILSAKEIYQRSRGNISTNHCQKEEGALFKKGCGQKIGAVQGGNVAVAYKKQTKIHFWITLLSSTDQQGQVCTKTERQKKSIFWSYLNEWAIISLVEKWLEMCENIFFSWGWHLASAVIS